VTTRRDFLQAGIVSAIGLSLPATAVAAATERARRRNAGPRGFIDILRAPDLVSVDTASAVQRLTAGTSDSGRAHRASPLSRAKSPAHCASS
jgi:hypothetical protein